MKRSPCDVGGDDDFLVLRRTPAHARCHANRKGISILSGSRIAAGVCGAMIQRLRGPSELTRARAPLQSGTEGHSVHVTDKGEEGANSPSEKQRRIRCVILDVMLPGKDGFTVARELRQGKDIPLLMLTARTRRRMYSRDSIGADDIWRSHLIWPSCWRGWKAFCAAKNWLRNSGSAKAEPVAEGEAPDLFEFDYRTVEFRHLQLRGGGQVFNHSHGSDCCVI